MRLLCDRLGVTNVYTTPTPVRLCAIMVASGGRHLVAMRQPFSLTNQLANFMFNTVHVDKQLFPSCLNNLILCLENRDGNSWNKLRSELESIYKVAPDGSYLPLASATCVEFATHYFWDAFPERDSFKTHWLIGNRSRLITAACVAIAEGERQEFELGNFSNIAS